MGEGKKIVTEHYPAGRLPEELRGGLAGEEMVKVTVEPEGIQSGGVRLMRTFLGSAPGLYGSPDEAVAFIRGLRDESDR